MRSRNNYKSISSNMKGIIEKIVMLERKNKNNGNSKTLEFTVWYDNSGLYLGKGYLDSSCIKAIANNLNTHEAFIILYSKENDRVSLQESIGNLIFKCEYIITKDNPYVILDKFPVGKILEIKKINFTAINRNKTKEIIEKFRKKK